MVKQQLFFIGNMKCSFYVNSKKSVSMAETWETFLSFIVSTVADS